MFPGLGAVEANALSARNKGELPTRRDPQLELDGVLAWRDRWVDDLEPVR
jgi:hypothetical protein